MGNSRTFTTRTVDTETGKVLCERHAYADVFVSVGFRETDADFSTSRLPTDHFDAFRSIMKDAGAYWASGTKAWRLPIARAESAAKQLTDDGFRVVDVDEVDDDE